MVGVQISREGQTVHHPVDLRCKFVVDPDMVLAGQMLGAKPHRGTPIGKLADVFPFSHLKQRALSEAQQFIGHMDAQGYKALEAETEMELWGPYREKLRLGEMRDVNYEEGNPFVPEGLIGVNTVSSAQGQPTTPRLISTSEMEHQDWRLGAAFLIIGKFDATVPHEEETTGAILV